MWTYTFTLASFAVLCLNYNYFTHRPSCGIFVGAFDRTISAFTIIRFLLTSGSITVFSLIPGIVDYSIFSLFMLIFINRYHDVFCLAECCFSLFLTLLFLTNGYHVVFCLANCCFILFFHLFLSSKSCVESIHFHLLVV